MSAFSWGSIECSAGVPAPLNCACLQKILKLLPLLLARSLGSSKLTPAAIGIAVGTCNAENVCY